jgi:hypothetical protein
MTALRGSRAGNISRKAGGFKPRERTSSEPPRGLLGARRRRRRRRHCSSSALPLLNSVGVGGEVQDVYNQEGMVVESRRRCEDGQRFSQFPGSFILY